MTDKQIEALREELSFKYWRGEPRTQENLIMEISPEDSKTFEELSCREMINSCLTYGSDPYRMSYQWWYGHGYCERSYMSDYEETLGKKRVKELVDEQRKTFETAIIHRGVYTDSEGVIYNSVEFKEEM